MATPECGFRVNSEMNHSPSHITSRPRFSWLWPLAKRKNFSAQEVRQRLQVDTLDDERTAAVHQAASETGLWSTQLPDRLAFDLGRAANRLPTVVFWYRQGVPAQEIGKRLSPFGGVWDAERALEAAATLIAHSLNQD